MSTESRKDKHIVRIELTEPQQEQIFKEVGKQAEALELSTTELEERIAPMLTFD
jgi:uncharacterized membrane protein (UPF0127 family)